MTGPSTSNMSVVWCGNTSSWQFGTFQALTFRFRMPDKNCDSIFTYMHHTYSKTWRHMAFCKSRFLKGPIQGDVHTNPSVMKHILPTVLKLNYVREMCLDAFREKLPAWSPMCAPRKKHGCTVRKLKSMRENRNHFQRIAMPRKLLGETRLSFKTVYDDQVADIWCIGARLADHLTCNTGLASGHAGIFVQKVMYDNLENIFEPRKFRKNAKKTNPQSGRSTRQ